MWYYSLFDTNTQRLCGHVADGRVEALAHYGELLGCTLTDEDDGTVEQYRLDEFEQKDCPHWVDHHIRIWVRQT